jgi:hypothetical protein
MVSSGVHRSYGDALVRASVGLRERFVAQVVAADSWTAGIAAALADVGDGLMEAMDSADVSLAELRTGGPAMRRVYDAGRTERLASLARAWRRHHPGAEVPELQLEFFVGAVGYAIVSGLQRGDLEDLAARMTGLTMLAPMAGA